MHMQNVFAYHVTRILLEKLVQNVIFVFTESLSDDVANDNLGRM